MATWECAACGGVSDDLWGACPGCRELRPAERGWPNGPTLPLLYPGDTQIDAAHRYRAHLRALAGSGYEVVATSWGDQRPDAGSALFLANVEEAYRVGTLLVTYRRSTAG